MGFGPIAPPVPAGLHGFGGLFGPAYNPIGPQHAAYEDQQEALLELDLDNPAVDFDLLVENLLNEENVFEMNLN